MTDIFGGKMFKREREEMKLRKKHQREIAKIERAQIISIASSIGSASTISTLQTEPIRQQLFPSFVDGHPILHRITNLVITPPATPEPHDISTEIDSGGRFRSTNSCSESIAYENIHFHSPPQRQSSHLSPPENHILPTIPKISPSLIPPQKFAHTRPQLSIPARPPPTSGFITLPSTPFSLTAPLFRHGPIRIDRSQKYFSPEDKSLDWTAFQISIIGIMDHHESVQDDVEWRPGEAEVDALKSWFSDFGFDIGCMVEARPDGWIKTYA